MDQQNTQKLIGFIISNPSLPIFPIINNSVISWFDENMIASYAIGNIGDSMIMNYCYFEKDGKKEFYTDLPDSIEHLIAEGINTNELDWKPAIFFFVER